MAKRKVKAKGRKAVRARAATAGKAKAALNQPVAFLQDSFKSFLGYFK